MSRNDVNREGLTFAEWVCAAGVARFDDGSVGVLPYTRSYTRAVEHGPGHYAKNGSFTDRRRLARCSVRYYPESVRRDWRNGVDPSEIRAGKK